MNVYISPKLKRTREYLDKSGKIIRKQVEGKDVPFTNEVE